ncbi:hypothetical protein [Aulosira sp. FACHB-615]|uniref:hypothetical protein n=1 Tax=Aulosira sp. FACHB-615 TaxID=2692777 RepID=UPI0016836DE5|nr:hypothetical protein [Aulosira sp. FACHB-615]MBD2492474.1 hypothetical protein [Aulosira sp. FACHB-615]
MKAVVTVGSVHFGEKVYQVGDELEAGEEVFAPLIAAGVVELVEETPKSPPKKQPRKPEEEPETP